MRLLVTLALRNLLRHKRRTLLTAAASASAFATASVPFAVSAISKTPIGPFQPFPRHALERGDPARVEVDRVE